MFTYVQFTGEAIIELLCWWVKGKQHKHTNTDLWGLTLGWGSLLSSTWHTVLLIVFRREAEADKVRKEIINPYHPAATFDFQIEGEFWDQRVSVLLVLPKHNIPRPSLSLCINLIPLSEKEGTAASSPVINLIPCSEGSALLSANTIPYLTSAALTLW